MDQDTQRDIQERLGILKSIKVFGSCDDTMYEQAISKSLIRYYDKDKLILVISINQHQGESNQLLYWILKGQVGIEKEINLIKHKKSRNLVRPDTSDDHMMSYEIRVKDKISLGTLSLQEYFPEVLPTYIKTLDSTFDRFELIQKLNDLDQVGYNKSTVTVKSITPVECLVMNRIDFVRLMSWDMFAQMKRDGYMYSLPPKLLQMEWVGVRDWKVEKQKLIRQTKRHIKGEKAQRLYLFQIWRNKVFESK